MAMTYHTTLNTYCSIHLLSINHGITQHRLGKETNMEAVPLRNHSSTTPIQRETQRAAGITSERLILTALLAKLLQ